MSGSKRDEILKTKIVSVLKPSEDNKRQAEKAVSEIQSLVKLSGKGFRGLLFFVYRMIIFLISR